jgi:hypothetical protein
MRPFCLKCAVAGFSGADAPGLLDIGDEYFAIADLARSCSFENRFDASLNHVFLYCYLDFGFRKKIDHIFRAAIELGMTTLPAKSFDFADSHSLNSNLAQCITYIVKAKWLHNGSDKLHPYSLYLAV